jgi:outer membrane lipoprotein-sorting protein
MRRLRRIAAASALAMAAGSACGGPSRPAFPSGSGSPFPGFDSAYQQATQECAGIRTITAEIALSGKAGSTKLRGRINAGFSAPGDMVLEGLAPFGKPAFLLAARGEEATLVLPRDERVLKGEKPAAIVEALAGVALAPAELRTAVAGCGLGTAVPAAGRSYGGDSAAGDGESGTVYLRRIDGRWRVAGAVREGLTLQYADFNAGRAATVFVRTAVSDLSLRLSQVEINAPLDPKVFEVDVPRNAVPLTLDELRRAGPLGEVR